MKRCLLLFVFISLSCTGFAQKDTLQIGDWYSEDQLYMLVSYNQLFDQPSQVNGSGFSYGLSSGYIKDIILNKREDLPLVLVLGTIMIRLIMG